MMRQATISFSLRGVAACLALMLAPAIACAYGQEEKALDAVKAHRWSEAEKALVTVRDPIVRDVVQFYLLRDCPQLSPFGEYASFLRRHPDWPNTDKLTTRAEIALITEGASASQMLEWFHSHPPQTPRGEFYLAEMKGPISAKDAQDAWRDADFTEIDEARVWETYRRFLGPQDIYRRVDRLLWEEKIDSAKRLIPRLSPDYQRLAYARIALMTKSKSADALVGRLSSAVRRDPGLLFERIRFRQDKGLIDDVPELLLRAPKNPPYPSKWWTYRRYAIRDAIDDGRISAAASLAADHGQESKIERSEALFLAGWIDLAFRNKPQPAFADFKTLYDTVEFPISKSRAAYWAARAAAASNNTPEMKRWLSIAAQWPMFFYGQLAQEELYGRVPLKMPPSVVYGEAEWQPAAKKSKLAKLCLELSRYGYAELATPFLVSMAQTAKTPQDAGLAVFTGIKMGRTDLSVRAAKEALNHGYYFQDYLFPRIRLPKALSVETPLAFAITRQESMFYPAAESPAGAVGMMQLLPTTAKLVAKKNGMAYSMQKLYDPAANLTLGSAYIDELMERFGNQRILAIAGYNAGPGRPSQWQTKYGALSSDDRANVTWIERIPFSETRNYVQRVLENYQVYRYLDSAGAAPMSAREALRP